MTAWTADGIEESILGGAMLEPELPAEALTLPPEAFSDRLRSLAWDAILESYAAKQPHDESSIASKIGEPRCFGTLASWVAATPTTASLGHWCRILAESARKRELKSRIAEIAKDVQDPDEVAARLEVVVRESKAAQKDDGLKHNGKPLLACFQDLQARNADPDLVRIAATGLADLDRMVELASGEVTLLAARPGMGKSAFVGGVAAYCARDKTRGATVMFSLEMSAVALVRRMIAAEARIPTHKLVANIGQPGFIAACEKINSLNLLIDDRSGLSVDEMSTALRKAAPIRVVIVDYLGVVRTNQRLERQDIRIGDVALRLKWLAKEFACHVVA